eukprot:4431317-Lingulodinium_polyedra.AAC.1
MLAHLRNNWARVQSYLSLGDASAQAQREHVQAEISRCLCESDSFELAPLLAQRWKRWSANVDPRFTDAIAFLFRRTAKRLP